MANEQETTFIGKCNFRGNQKVFGIKRRDRRQHMYVLGMTGTGKSTLLENMALQDIHAGRGLGIIDPHGEFVERVLTKIPEKRAKDVVYFDPVDTEHPIGFNVLEVSNPEYKHLVVSDLLGIFTKIWAGVWSARMEYILQNCIAALLDTPGTTLLGIPRLLVDKDYRQKIVVNVKDPVVRSFWLHEYETWQPRFRNEAIVPVQNKVGQFLNTGFIRNIVGQPKSTINIPEIMNENKILLVNVSKGKVGEDNSQLLGAMIITKIQLAAMERIRIPEEDRQDFYLLVDEFQNFATESFASILSEARKYRLNLLIAHQYIGQLVSDVSTKVRDAVFGNVGTMITFRVGATDAEFLEKEFTPEFAIHDLISQPNYHIYLKLMVDGVASRPFSAATLPILTYEDLVIPGEEIIEQSRRLYASDRETVEENIRRWSGGGEAALSEVPAERGGSENKAGASSPPPVLSPSGKEIHESPCWNCGKTATVPFKPDGKRPVYCSNCLKQIEEGTIIPLPERMPKERKVRFSDTLSELGIGSGAEAAVRSAEQRLPQRSDSGRGASGGERREERRDMRSAGGGERRDERRGTRPPRREDTHRRDERERQERSPLSAERNAPRSARPESNRDRRPPRAEQVGPSGRHDRRSEIRQEKRSERRHERKREFERRPSDHTRDERPVSSQQFSAPIKKSEPVVRVFNNSKTISLSQLKSKSPHGSGDKEEAGGGSGRAPGRGEKPGSQTHISELRKTLKGIMGSGEKSGHSEAPRPPKEGGVAIEAQNDSQEGVMRPGDSIKL